MDPVERVMDAASGSRFSCSSPNCSHERGSSNRGIDFGQTSHGQVDGDLAINSMMWQNAGKSGLDQWNFTLQPTSKGQVMAFSSFVVAVTLCSAQCVVKYSE